MSKYTEAVESGLKGLEAVSIGVCPGCSTCQSDWGYDDPEKFELDWENGKVYDEPHFSWSPCGICGSTLGGDREPWHHCEGEEIEHEPGACIDCVCYLANGDEPDNWE